MFFAEHCDLVCVFFDPIGQALCERTMAVVEELNDFCPDKVSYVSMSRGTPRSHITTRFPGASLTDCLWRFSTARRRTR